MNAAMNLDTEALILYRWPAELAAEGAARIRTMVDMAVQRCWQGNLWHCCLTQALVESENPFSLAWERRSPERDSLWELALQDMEVWFRLFRYTEDSSAWRMIEDFHHAPAGGPGAQALMALAQQLAAAETPEAMLCLLTAFYRDHGLGMLGLGQVFRVDEAGRLYPVENRRAVHLSDLVGYEDQKRQLVDNTLAFLNGHRGNNVMLYGDAGTGKSTSIQALAEEFAPRGLRLVELYKHQFAEIPALFRNIKNRNYRFILLLDDLSFEENEVEYKYLKAVLEGGAEAAPENIRIYATSNRRHLIKETWNDRNDMEHNGDIHRSDTTEEKLSLSARFGLQIFYPNPSFEEYHAIVQSIAAREAAAAGLTEEQLRAAASTWQVRHGSRSGRTARQFVDSLSCRDTEGKEHT